MSDAQRNVNKPHWLLVEYNWPHGDESLSPQQRQIFPSQSGVGSCRNEAKPGGRRCCMSPRTPRDDLAGPTLFVLTVEGGPRAGDKLINCMLFESSDPACRDQGARSHRKGRPRCERPDEASCRIFNLMGASSMGSPCRLPPRAEGRGGGMLHVRVA